MVDINIEAPSKAEIEQALSELKRNKTLGPARVTTEALLANTKVTTETLSVLFTKLREEEKLPVVWKDVWFRSIRKSDPRSHHQRPAWSWIATVKEYLTALSVG
jgi:hypothetical protein